MSTKQEEKTAYQRLHDLENELADVLKRIRKETYLAMQEAMRHYFEERPNASKEEGWLAFQDLMLREMDRRGDTYSSSRGRTQVFEQTIKDTVLRAWQDARYEDVREWANDETRVVWLP